MRHICLFAVVLALSGCGSSPTASPPPSKPMTREGKLAGVWTGKVPEAPNQANEGKASNFLADKLGGYSIRLTEDGKFIADWRGLTKDGTWKVEKDKILLETQRVFGKTKSQADEENKLARKAVNDLSLYDADNTLLVGAGDASLTLPAGQKGASTVKFVQDSK